jgi:hypothetical protein
MTRDLLHEESLSVVVVDTQLGQYVLVCMEKLYLGFYFAVAVVLMLDLEINGIVDSQLLLIILLVCLISGKHEMDVR